MNRATVFGAAAAIGFGAALPSPAQEPFGVTLLPVHVVRHGNVAISNSEVDLVIASATRVVAVADYSGDVGARVSIQREGAVASSNAFPCTIASRADYDAAFAATAADALSVKRKLAVVCRINWCGSLSPGIIGCGDQPGTRFMQVRHTRSLEGILTAHEYGHTKNLGHRNDETAVMNPYIVSTALGLNGSEAAAYGSTSLHAFTGQVSSTAALPLKEFVKQTFPHGVPYAEAKAYGATALPALRGMLADPALTPHWPNIVIVMGINGDKSTFAVLRKHLERKGEGILQLGDYDSRIFALAAMGYNANNLKPGNQNIIKYLTASTDPKTWQAKKLKWRSPSHAVPTEAAVTDDLVGQAILGLALSGDQKAAAALEAMIANPAKAAVMTAPALQESLSSNRSIASKGLVAYYADARLNQ